VPCAHWPSGPRRREQVALDIALLGQKGLHIADPVPKYILKSLPGGYSGLPVPSIVLAALRQIDPAIDIGADFPGEYELAQAGANPQVPPT